MNAIWIGLLAPLALALGGAPQASAQSFEVPFTCTIDLGELTEADVAAIPVPSQFRGRSFITTGQKQCTGGEDAVQIRCTTTLAGWSNPRNRTIKDFVEPCQFLEGECGTPDRLRIANNQTFTIRRINATTAQLDLFCVSDTVPAP